MSAPSPRPGLVLLATDLGSASAAAERAAIELAAERGWPLLAVSVVDPSRLLLPGGRWLARVDQVRSDRDVGLRSLVGRAASHGVAVRTLIWQGSPGESILEAARAEGAELIVVGSHDRGRVGRLLLGSVSSHVVRAATTPVIVVHPDGTRSPFPADPGAAAVAPDRDAGPARSATLAVGHERPA